MNLFNTSKKSLQELKIPSWITLHNSEALDVAHQQSFEKPVVLFKHSTSCGLSAQAKYRLESSWDQLKHEVAFYFLDLLAFRHISDAIAKTYEVIHHSPQMIVVMNGKAHFHNSHHKISISELNAVLDKVERSH